MSDDKIKKVQPPGVAYRPKISRRIKIFELRSTTYVLVAFKGHKGHDDFISPLIEKITSLYYINRYIIVLIKCRYFFDLATFALIKLISGLM